MQRKKIQGKKMLRKKMQQENMQQNKMQRNKMQGRKKQPRKQKNMINRVIDDVASVAVAVLKNRIKFEKRKADGVGLSPR